MPGAVKGPRRRQPGGGGWRGASQSRCSLADRAGEPALGPGGRPAGLPPAGRADPGRAGLQAQATVSPFLLHAVGLPETRSRYCRFPGGPWTPRAPPRTAQRCWERLQSLGAGFSNCLSALRVGVGVAGGSRTSSGSSWSPKERARVTRGWEAAWGGEVYPFPTFCLLHALGAEERSLGWQQFPGGAGWGSVGCSQLARVWGAGLGVSSQLPQGSPPTWQQHQQLGGGFPGLGTEGSGTGCVAADTRAFTAGCGKPLRAPGENTSPRPGNPSTWESQSSPMGASPAPPPLASQVTAGKGCAPPGPGCSLQTVGLGSPRSPSAKGTPGMGPATTPELSAHLPLCSVCEQLRRPSDLPTSPSGPPAGACVSVTAPVYGAAAVCSGRVSHAPSPVEVGAHRGQSSQPLVSREGAGHQAAYPRLWALASPCTRGAART